MPSFRPARSIREVITRLDELIRWATESQSAIGIFPALYVVVTEEVKAGIDAGDVFDDGRRMEQLDVTFANRYLHAVHQYQNGDRCSECWDVAFRASDAFLSHLIVQELILGINAHIGLDLGVAAAAVSPRDQIHALRKDFNTVNGILEILTRTVKDDLEVLSPRLRLMFRLLFGEDAVVGMSIRRSRDVAWRFATTLAPLNEDEQLAHIAEKDRAVAQASNGIALPPSWQRPIVTWVNRRESKDLSRIIHEIRTRTKNRAQPRGMVARQARMLTSSVV